MAKSRMRGWAAEIDRTLKKVEEGIDIVEKMWESVRVKVLMAWGSNGGSDDGEKGARSVRSKKPSPRIKRRSARRT